MNFFKLFSVLSLSLITAACSSLINGQTQEVTLLTPGATEAECSFDNGVRYPITTGETITIMRNEKAIKIDCYASGNRHRMMTIESDGNDWAIGNIATGIIPGMTFDHFSRGLYEYPETITVDFVGVPTTGFETPMYQNKDAPNPYEQPIEYYGPTTPKQESDKYFLKNEVKKKVRADVDPFSASMGTGSSTSSSGGGDGITPMPGATSKTGGAVVNPSSSGSPRGSNAEELTRSANPSVFRTN